MRNKTRLNAMTEAMVARTHISSSLPSDLRKNMKVNRRSIGGEETKAASAMFFGFCPTVKV